MKTRLRLLLAACSLCFMFTASAQPPDIRQGLVAYWPLDAHDTLTTPDLAGANTLNVVGNPAVGAGQFGNAFTFNGTSIYLTNLHTVDNGPTGLPIYRAGSYTICMWVKGAAQTAKFLYGEGATNVGGVTAGQNPIVILQTGQTAANNAKFDVILRSDTGGTLLNHVASSNIVFDNTWHHIAWVDNRGQARLYVDGNLDPANFNYTPAGVFSLNTSAIGALIRANVAGVFNGQIDDVAIWERALTQAEVQTIRNSSISTPIPVLPPYIVTQPAGGVRMVGDRFRFSISATGPRPVSYQWLKNEMEVTDATNTFLALSNLTPGDSGNYSVRVTAASVSVTSSVATLTVVADPAPDLRLGLISHWPLDAENPDMGGGLVSPDLYSNNDMREITAVPTFLGVAGQNGQALAFNGVDQYTLRRGGFPIYNNPAYSVSLWVNGAGTGQSDRRFFSESSTNNANPLFNLGTHATGVNGTIRVFIRNDAGTALLAANSTRTALDNTWHHVVWTETNGFGRLYIDGVLDETDFLYTRGTLTLDQTSLAAIFRNNQVGFYFAGAIDDVAVWNRVLTLSEINEVRTTGIPAPITSIPPTITQHPASLALLTKSKATFTFQATGTSPLFAQWRKNGMDITDETNTSLVLNNIQLGDAGDYDVVVTNAAGRATSEVAVLSITLRPPPPEILRVDINNTGADNTPANTEDGFAAFAIPSIGTGPFTQTFGGADLTLRAVGTTMESRKRALPTNNPPFTEERILQDFVFTRDAAVDQGLDVNVEFLEANTPYRVSIWSYDNVSVTLDRISDWTAQGLPVRTAWTFFGSNLPVDNSTYRFNFDTVSDANGAIAIQARRSPSAQGNLNCFLNAIAVEKRQLRVLSLENFMNLDITLVFEALNPAATHRIQSRTQLGTGVWADVPDAVFTPLGGNVISTTFSAPFPAVSTQFYRVVQDPVP